MNGIKYHMTYRVDTRKFVLKYRDKGHTLEQAHLVVWHSAEYFGGSVTSAFDAFNREKIMYIVIKH